MVVTPLKRNASRSPPEGNRQMKRLLTSSPEEGEVDEPNPPPLIMPMPSIAPIALPPKPSALQTAKVPFPFKKKTDVSKPGATTNVFERCEGRALEDNRGGKNAVMDHWEPTYGRGDPRLRTEQGRDGWDPRDRRRSPPRGDYPSTHSHSPGSPHYRGRHSRHSHSPNSFSPLSPRGFEKTRERSRAREHDRDYRERWEDDSRRYRRQDLSVDRRHYRPSSPSDHRRDARGSTREDRGYDYEPRNRYNYSSSRWSSSRHASPNPSTRSELASPHPPTIHTKSHTPLPQPPDHLPRDAGPRPPSCTPPPAPPPDPRLSKLCLPLAPPVNQASTHSHSHANPLQRPNAPKNMHSPIALEMRPAISSAKAMTHDTESRAENTQSQRVPPPSEPSKEHMPAKTDSKVSDHPLIQLLRSKNWSNRTPKEEVQLYGHGFTGCGKQADYETTTKLGEGTFGEVHKAIHKATGSIVALKRILMHNEKEGMPVTALREIKILKALKHPSIVNILDMFVVRSTDDRPLSVYMVFPYMDHDLAGLLENERVKLQPSHIKLYMKQLLEGTAYMHQNHILHRDMKAANLLISNDGTLKVADFGLARSFDSSVSDNGPCKNNSSTGASGGRYRDKKYTNCVVTRWYRPPELLLGARHYGGEVDIWGIGCVLGEMFTRKPILPGTSDLDQLEKIWFLCGSPNQHNWPYFDQLPGCEGVIRFNPQPRRLKTTYESVGPETVDLLDQLLRINPKERLTAATALEHDYFWTDPLPADPKTMPSYEASHEFDKRGHRHPPPPQARPVGQPGPHHHGRGGPPGNNARFNNNRFPRHVGGGPDTKHQGLKPPAGPLGRYRSSAQLQQVGPPNPNNHPNISLLHQPPPNVVYPDAGYHGGLAVEAGLLPNMPPNMPPVLMYGTNGVSPSISQPLGNANSFGPLSFQNAPSYPLNVLPPQSYTQTPQGYGPQHMNFFPSLPPHGHSRRPQGGRGRWEQGQRNHNYSSGHQNSLPKPPSSLPAKPVVPTSFGPRDNIEGGNRAGRGDRPDESEELSYG